MNQKDRNVLDQRVVIGGGLNPCVVFKTICSLAATYFRMTNNVIMLWVVGGQ